IPSCTLESLSTSPHFVRPGIAVAKFVSPGFSKAMRQMVLAYFVSTGLTPHFEGEGDQAGMDASVSLSLFVRQITTLAKLASTTQTGTATLYDRPLLKAPPQPPGIPAPSESSPVSMSNAWYLNRAVSEAAWHSPSLAMYDAFLWTRLVLH
ncbi:hypothetical protein KIPB_011320, partial [Kipferlia bialata]